MKFELDPKKSLANAAKRGIDFETARCGSFPSGGPENRRLSSMKTKRLAQSNEEFDRRFDQGEDIHQLIDLSKAAVDKPGKKMRITLDVSRALIEEIDAIRQSIGVDRGALIKVWLHERVQQEKEKVHR
jgi:hypothetical protein